MSNTAKIIEAFWKGYEEAGNTTEVWYLSDRRQWPEAKEAFGKNDNILFALPLYVENIPGIMLEFLEQLPPKTVPGTRIAFLLQGGFPEASQSRYFAKMQKFDQTDVNKFAAPEYMPANQIRLFNLIGRPVQRIFMGRMAKKLGCQERLDAKPYEHVPRFENRFGEPQI